MNQLFRQDPWLVLLHPASCFAVQDAEAITLYTLTVLIPSHSHDLGAAEVTHSVWRDPVSDCSCQFPLSRTEILCHFAMGGHEKV